MAEQAHSANWNAELPQRGMRALWRLAIWGGLATFALFTAVLSAYSHAGAERQAATMASGQGTGQPRSTAGEAAPRSAETADEIRRLAESVRALAADRDQLLTRLAALERNLDGVTGSIKRERTATAPTPSQSSLPNPAPAATSAAPLARPEMPAAPATEAATTPTAPPPSPAPVSQPADSVQTPAPDAANRVASASNPMNATGEPLTPAPKLGVDIGGAVNFEGLRTLWRSTKSGDAALLEELYPLVGARENGKTHGTELRLIVGPIADAEAAARLCTTLAAVHRYCQPVAFEGQRLSLVDATPAKGAPLHHAAPTPPNVLSEPPPHTGR